MTEEKEDHNIFSCIDCDRVLLCPYDNVFQCPLLTVERNAGNE